MTETPAGGISDIDAMAAFVTAMQHKPPKQRIAALNWLNDRMRSDMHKERDAAQAVGEFVSQMRRPHDCRA